MSNISQLAELLYTIAELSGVVAFAVSGAMTATERDSDLFGTVLLGITTTLGGGALRDVMLGITPPTMFSHPTQLVISALVSLAVFLTAAAFGNFYKLEKAHIDRIINVFDAVGLGIFSVLGVRVARAAGYSDSYAFCVFLGFLTACGGGLLRDIMTVSMPFILYKRIYAAASIVGATLYCVLTSFGGNETASMALSAGCVFAIRMLATRYKWDFPRINADSCRNIRK